MLDPACREHRASRTSDTHRFGERRQFRHDAVVGDDGEILLVTGDVGDRRADAGQHLAVVRLQQANDQLETAHEASNHFARILPAKHVRH